MIDFLLCRIVVTSEALVTGRISVQ